MKGISVLQNIQIALQSIKAQILRAILTMLIIAIGISALVGILTAIDAIKTSLTGNFALLGANTFTIQNRGPNIQIGRSGSRPKYYKQITYYEALKFKERMDKPSATTSVSFTGSYVSEVKFENLATNPNIRVMGVDENFLQTGGYEIEEGRNFIDTEIDEALSVAVIGQELVNKLYAKTNPLGTTIQLGGKRFRVIGTLKSKGNSFGMGGDQFVWIPITTARSIYSTNQQSFAINVMASDGIELENTISEATAIMRAVRKRKPKEESNFHITKSDNLSETLIENLGSVTGAAVFIAFITLFGAAIALMNIMLVSVTERTREIGIRKAIGAKRKSILGQFLTESIVICVFGGCIGIFFGIIIGNITSYIIGSGFIIPWDWMLVSVLVCILVGLVSGIYPALKASKLDPIEALRYE